MKKVLILAFFWTAFSARAADEPCPAWVSKPESVCAPEEICQTGAGDSFASASAAARAAVGRIFETKVHASFSRTFSQSEDETASALQEAVHESSETVLQAVSVRETCRAADGFYALAVLNKTAAAKILRRDMSALDAEMKDRLAAASPASAVRAEKLYARRHALNRRYVVLTEEAMPETVSWKQISENKKAKVGRRHVFLRIQSERPAPLEAAVRSALGKNGYTFAGSRTAAASEIIASLEAEPVEMSAIKEVVKYDFFFSLKVPESPGSDIEVLSFSFDEAGLNKSQAFSEAAETVRDFLEKHLNEIPF